MRVLLTGASGFVGRRLLTAFIGAGDTPVVLARDGAPARSLPSGVESLRSDDFVRDPVGAARGRPIEALVHAATDYGTGEAGEAAPFWSNVAYPMRLLEAASRAGIARFVNLDTFFSADNVRYDHLRAYALSKRHFREWGAQVATGGEIAFANLRLFHIYGPGDSPRKFVPSIVAQCLAGGPIQLTSGEQRRDFLHVDDAVGAVLAVAKRSIGVGHHHFDVGTGRGVRIRDFVEMVNKECGSRATLQFGALPARAGEPELFAQPEALEATGWRRRFDLESGIRDVVSSMRPTEPERAAAR